MIREHGLDLIEPGFNDKVWRYLDFTKYVELLHSETLFFSELRLMEDKFEGSLTRPTVDKRNLAAGEHTWKIQGWEAYAKQFKDSAVINCWHKNEFESAAMWSLYIKSKEGVAIQGTYGKMRECLDLVDCTFRVGSVQYKDYELDEMKQRHTFDAVFSKRKSYEHEQEIRAVTVRADDIQNENAVLVNGGVKVKVDLRMLIDNVYVYPDAQPWFFELIKNVTMKYGFDFKVIHSGLEQKPLY